MSRWPPSTRINFKISRCCSPSMRYSVVGPKRRPHTSPTMVPSTESTGGRLSAPKESHGNHCVGGTQRTQDSGCTAGLRTHAGIHHVVSLAIGFDSALRGLHSQLRIRVGSLLGSGDGAAGIGLPAIEL